MSRILLIVGGGIAAYKACEIIRLLRKGGHSVRCVLTEGGSHFVTPMTLAALSEQEVHTTLWDLKDEAEMGHIQLSRQADLALVAPATADLLARMAGGLANDLATTLLLATDKPVLAAPAMNVRMWQHPATQRNVAQLRADGVRIMAPDEGAMACGEFGPGRLPEPTAIVAEVERQLGLAPAPADAVGQIAAPGARLAGKHVLVTAGPTHE
ncbi:MAG: flavoprotein, partial [Sphingomonas sp.]